MAALSNASGKSLLGIRKENNGTRCGAYVDVVDLRIKLRGKLPYSLQCYRYGHHDY